MLLTPRGWRRSRRVVLGMVSILVLGATGYAWMQLSKLDTGITTANVIEPSAQTPTGTKSLTVDQNILLVGLDSRTDAQGNPLPQDLLNMLHAGDSSDGGDTTDTMIVVHIPAGGGAATAISIPRDSYVDLAGGFGKHKINSAYSRGKNAAVNSLSAKGVSGAALEVQSNEAGAKATIQTVEKLTGLTINHYAAVNLAGFYSLSVAVGGVQVCLNNAVNDRYSGANFPAGVQTIAGADALKFVRQRHGLNSDLDRIVRQQAFLASLAKTILGAGTLTDPTKLSNLIEAVQGSIVIDQGWDILSFASQLHGLSSGAIQFGTIPVQSLSLPTPSDGDAVKVDPAQVKAFVANVMGSGASAAGNTTTSVTTPPAGTPRGAQAMDISTSSTTPAPPPVTPMTGCVN
ncbi:LCP family protein [Amycolatopsis sp.]|uniref:LCP family protein n=1 Tax=Amycolatopsis sp. TaxID=37632 RepID=UPI002DFF492D|nr:LCP family protein [Amycolatopsis sp.]